MARRHGEPDIRTAQDVVNFLAGKAKSNLNSYRWQIEWITDAVGHEITTHTAEETIARVRSYAAGLLRKHAEIEAIMSVREDLIEAIEDTRKSDESNAPPLNVEPVKAEEPA